MAAVLVDTKFRGRSDNLPASPPVEDAHLLLRLRWGAFEEIGVPTEVDRSHQPLVQLGISLGGGRCTALLSDWGDDRDMVHVPACPPYHNEFQHGQADEGRGVSIRWHDASSAVQDYGATPLHQEDLSHPDKDFGWHK